VALSGVGLAPVAGFSAANLGFGNLPLSTTGSPLTETVTNTGTANLSITSVVLGGPNVAAFAKTADTCTGATLVPTGTCAVTVTFTASSTGTMNATLTFTDNSNYVTGSTQVVNLSGTGGGPVVTLATPALSFANQPMNATSAVLTETVTNTGLLNLTIASVVVGGTNAGDFTKSVDTCSGATVAPNATCAVSVTFTPAATGARAATLTFTDNDNDVAGSTQTVNLSGTGVDFTLTTTGGTQTTAQGGQAKYTITLTPLGGTFSGSVTLACSNLPAEATCAFSPSAPSPGASGSSSQLTITTSAQVYARTLPPVPTLPPSVWLVLLLATFLLVMMNFWRTRRQSPRWALVACGYLAILLATCFLAACGGGGFPLPKVGGTPVGTYTVTVTGTAGSTQHSTTITLSVTGA
jgi:hypothetical protein